MIISETYKYIFIAVPKNASVSIEKYLMQNDKSATRNRITLNNKKIPVPEHITAQKLKEIMGLKYEEYKKIAFVRNPYAKLVSSYFFYKNGKPITKGNHNPYPILPKIYLARILPFSIWSIVYPFKTNRYHLIGKDKSVLVNYIGTIENLENDFKRIFIDIGLEFLDYKLPHRNKSTHTDSMAYYKSKWHKYLIDKKLKKDISFYNNILKNV